jgi:hypothetical protein
MPMIEGTSRLKTLEAVYDFAVDGGAQGNKTLRPGDSMGNLLPAGAVVVGGYLDVETSVLSATGTVALTVEAAGDLLTATAQAGLTAGRKDLNVDSTGSTAIKTSQARSVVMTVATAALTAGKFRVVVFYK